MTAAEIIEFLYFIGATVWVEDGELRIEMDPIEFYSPLEEDVPDLDDQIEAHVKEIIAILTREPPSSSSDKEEQETHGADQDDDSPFSQEGW